MAQIGHIGQHTQNRSVMRRTNTSLLRSANMDKWSALLVPHPLFTGKKRLYQLTAPSSFDSRSSFMSSLSDGTQKRRKLTKTCPTSSPPEIQPLSFEHEPMLDMTTNIFDFFPPHDTSNVNDNVHFFTLNGDCTTLDGNLVSQPLGHAQGTNTHFPHAIISTVSQTISSTPVNPNSSLVTVSMPSNAATGQSEANSPFFNFPNPLGYISRKLAKRRRTTRIPKSASTPIIPSEATPLIDSIPSFSSTPITATSSKSTPILSSPSCPPPVSAAINDFHSLIGVTDNLILASSTVPPQHAPQCSHLQAESGDPAPNPIVHTPGISSPCEDKIPKLPHELIGRLDNSVHHHKPELASKISAGITEVTPQSGFRAPEHTGERAFSSKHLQLPTPSSGFERPTSDMREADLEATRSETSHLDNQEFQAIPIAAEPSDTYKASGENSHQYRNAIVHRMTDDGMENKEILLQPTLNHSVVPSSALQQHPQLQSNEWVSVTPLLSAPPAVTSSSHGHGWSSSGLSGELLRHDQSQSPSMLGEEEGTVGENTVGDVMETQELPLGSGSKPLGPGFTLSKRKWKKSLYSSREETVASIKSDPGVNQVELGLSAARGDGDGLSRSGFRSLQGYSQTRPQIRQRTSELESNKANCEASQLISSTPTDDSSAVAITQVTAFAPLSGPVAHPESGTKCPTETSGTAANKGDHKWVKNNFKPKFIIGDLEEATGEFPSNTVTSTQVRGEPERAALEYPITAAPRPRLVRRKPITDEEAQSRRWTLASALTDEKISDAGLVKVLDRMRDDIKGQEGDGTLDVEKVILEGWGTPDAEGSKHSMIKVPDENAEHGGTPSLSPDEYGSYPSQTEVSLSSRVAIDRGFRSRTMKQHNRSRSTPSQTWIAAQRALLTCRELILTERNYVAQLSALVQQQTATPPPPLMCEYAKELLRACEHVLKRMEKDPSARGVSRAFLEGEEEVRGAYVMWCGAVGGWFSVDGSGQDGSTRLSLDFSEVSNRVRRLSVKRRNRVGSKTDVDRPTSITGSEGEDLNQLKRTVSTWRKSMPTLGFDTPALYGGDRKREKESERESTSPSARKPAVRELAILPTQRVMRYALIYHELLSHTPPTSPSRTFVERAAHAATRIAEKCDLAQGNAAFIASSSSNSNGGGSHTRSNSRVGIQLTPSRVPPLPTTTLLATESLAYDTVPATPTSMRSAVDPPFRSSTQFFQPTNNKSNTEIVTSPRRLSVSFMSLGWGKGNKQKLPAPSESIQVLHTAAGVSSLAYDA